MLEWKFTPLFIWGLIILGAIPWVFSKNSGWLVTKRYSFALRMMLMVPFYNKWESRVSPEDQPAVRNYRRRAQIYYYLLFLSPLVMIWVSLSIWVLTT